MAVELGQLYYFLAHNGPPPYQICEVIELLENQRVRFRVTYPNGGITEHECDAVRNVENPDCYQFIGHKTFPAEILRSW